MLQLPPASGTAAFPGTGSALLFPAGCPPSLPPCFPWPPALLWMPDLCRGSSCLSPLIVFWLRWLFAGRLRDAVWQSQKANYCRREGNHSTSPSREGGPEEPCLVNPLKNKAGCSWASQSGFWRSLKQHQQQLLAAAPSCCVRN